MAQGCDTIYALNILVTAQISPLFIGLQLPATLPAIHALNYSTTQRLYQVRVDHKMDSFLHVRRSLTPASWKT